MWPFTRKSKPEPRAEPAAAPDLARAVPDSPLASLQREFFSLVVKDGQARAVPEALVNGGALTAQARLDVYAGMYELRTQDALREDFPHTAALLGDAFPAVVARYVAAHPSTHHSLARLGHAFAESLKRESGLRPDLPELARLEWARSEAFVAIDADPIGSEVPAALGHRFATAWLQFVPSLALLELHHDVLAVWRAMEAQEPAPEPSALSEPAWALVWRRGFEVFHVAIAADEAQAVQAARDRLVVAVVCEAFARREDPATAAFQAIGSWLNEGMVAAVREPPQADTFVL